MDIFQYKIQLQKLNTLTTAKAIDAFCRERKKELDNTTGYMTVHSKHTVTEVILSFKLLHLGIEKYPGKTPLARFITLKHEETTKIISRHLIDNKGTYEQLIDAYEHVSHIELYDGGACKVGKLADIVGDNPLPFTIEYDFNASAKYDYVLQKGSRYSIGDYNMVNVLQLEELKRARPPNIRYTVLEDLLDMYYAKMSAAEKTPNKLNFLTTNMDNLVTIAATVAARIRNAG